MAVEEELKSKAVGDPFIHDSARHHIAGSAHRFMTQGGTGSV